MIIGEPTNQYDGYEEEHYDYLFKRNKGGAPTPRQQKKIEKRAAKGKPPGRLMQKRLDRQAGITPKKRLIMGNFGLFNKNKNQEVATQDAAAQTDPGQFQDATPVEDTAQSPEMNAAADANTSADPQASVDTPAENNGSDTPPESSYDDYDDYDDAASTKSESKSQDKDSAKNGGAGVWVGWAFLGLTVVVIGYTMYRLDKMEAKLVPNDRLHHPNY